MTNGPTTQPPPLPFDLAPPEDRPPVDVWRSVEDLLTGKNLFRAGLGLLLLGLAFLFRYGLDQGWIGPTARIGAGAATSVALVAVGLRISARRPSYGQLLQGGGVAGLYLTAYASYRVYGMVDETLAFVQLAAVSAAGVALALRSRAQPLAVAAVAGALAAPVLVAGQVVGFPGDGGYIVAVLAVTVLLAFRHRWHVLAGVGAAGTVALIVGDLYRLEIGSEAPSRAGVQVVIAALWLGYLAVPLLTEAGRRMTPVPEIATVVTPFTVFGLTWALWHSSTSPETLALVAAGLAATHLAMWIVLPAGRLRHLQIIPAAALAAVAVVLGLDGPIVGLALAAEAFGVGVAGRKLDLEAFEVAGHAGLGLTTLLSVAWFPLEDMAGPVLVNGAALARWGILALVIAIAILLDRWADEARGDRSLKMVYAVMAHLAALLLLWVDLVRVDLGLVTVGWGALGLGVVVFGGLAKRRPAVVAGVATLLVAVVKLFMVDLAAVDAVWRILLLAGFGVVLLAVGYWTASDE